MELTAILGFGGRARPPNPASLAAHPATLCTSKDKHMSNKVTEVEMIEALKRSGYLLESEISSILANSGFFVESNQVIQDPVTGKSREIDLLAEYYEYRKTASDLKCSSSIKFVFEMKNNLFPIALLTRFENSPNTEAWTGLKESLNLPEGVMYDSHLSFYENLIVEANGPIFTQYCSFHKKKSTDDLMALHPDNIHTGLMKIVQYCEEQMEIYDTSRIYDPEDGGKVGDYFRHHLYLPILLISDDLYEFHEGELEKKESSILVYNYHYKGEPQMAYVFVVTRSGFEGFMEKMVKLERKAEHLMEHARSKCV